MNAENNRAALSVTEAAASLGIGRTSLYKLIESGAIRSLKIGRRTVIPASEPDRYLVERLREASK